MSEILSAKIAHCIDHLKKCLIFVSLWRFRLGERFLRWGSPPSRAPIAMGGSLRTVVLLTVCLGTTGLMATSVARAASAGCPDGGPMDPDCGQHNMMIVGDQTIFLSHLPMFHSEHRFQVIVEVAFDKDGISLDSVYADDRQKHPDVRMYTLEPQELFVLSQLFRGDPETLRRAFPGTVFRGHLERGGTPLEQLTDVEVGVKRVVYATEIGPQAGPTRPDELDYILFGSDAELFLAHRITQPPDFDQLLGVTVSGHQFTEEELARGVAVRILDRPNSPAQRLRTGETTNAQGHVTGAHMFLPLEVNVSAEYYFEEGELKDDPKFRPTPLEIEAGF